MDRTRRNADMKNVNGPPNDTNASLYIIFTWGPGSWSCAEKPTQRGDPTNVFTFHVRNSIAQSMFSLQPSRSMRAHTTQVCLRDKCKENYLFPGNPNLWRKGPTPRVSWRRRYHKKPGQRVPLSVTEYVLLGQYILLWSQASNSTRIFRGAYVSPPR